jgi:hypothetical protein
MRETAVAERIVALGFRRWHERQLIIAHGWLAACFIAMVGAAAGLELLTMGGGLADFLVDAALIGTTGLFGWHAWRRYRAAMQRADALESQAVCPGCARFGFRASRGTGGRVIARCGQCGSHWEVETDRVR